MLVKTKMIGEGYLRWHRASTRPSLVGDRGEKSGEGRKREGGEEREGGRGRDATARRFVNEPEVLREVGRYHYDP